MSLELLPFDTELFGIQVARVVGFTGGLDQLNALFDGAKKQGVVLLYLSMSKSSIDEPVDDFVQKIPAECSATSQVVLRIPSLPYMNETLEPLRPNLDGLTVSQYADSTPNQELIELAVAAGHMSRFAADPKFPAEWRRRLYTEWIKNNCNGKLADVVLVARFSGDGKVVGFVSVKKAGPAGTTSICPLMAVEKSMRKKNLGLALAIEAIAWSVRNGMKDAQHRTQVGNAPAIQLYKNVGSYEEDIVHDIHIWMDDRRSSL
jgi:GNAT superfamily N-acetyltransferase